MAISSKKGMIVTKNAEGDHPVTLPVGPPAERPRALQENSTGF